MMGRTLQTLGVCLDIFNSAKTKGKSKKLRGLNIGELKLCVHSFLHKLE